MKEEKQKVEFSNARVSIPVDEKFGTIIGDDDVVDGLWLKTYSGYPILKNFDLSREATETRALRGIERQVESVKIKNLKGQPVSNFQKYTLIVGANYDVVKVNETSGMTYKGGKEIDIDVVKIEPQLSEAVYYEAERLIGDTFDRFPLGTANKLTLHETLLLLIGSYELVVINHWMGTMLATEDERVCLFCRLWRRLSRRQNRYAKGLWKTELRAQINNFQKTNENRKGTYEH